MRGTFFGSQTRAQIAAGTRVAFLLLAVSALFAGLLGFHRHLAGPAEADFGNSGWDMLYYSLQMFVLSAAPLEHGGPFPPLLEFARFAAPLATGYALFEAGRALLAGSIRRMRNQRARQHVVVTGDTTAAYAMVAQLQRQRNHVIHIPTGTPAALRATGLGRASALYACEDDHVDSGANVAAALTAAHLRTSHGLRVHAQVSDPHLCLALRARRLALPADDALHLDFFNVDELAARQLLRCEDLQVPDGRPHLMVMGAGAFARAAVIEYARQWRLRGPRPAEPVQVFTLDTNAERFTQSLTASHRVVRETCELTAIQQPLEDFLLSRTRPIPQLLIFCQEDERQALRTAVETAGLWANGPGSAVVRLDRLDHHSGAFHSAGTALLDNLGGRLRLIGIAKLACVPAVVGEDLVEQLAQTIHENYLVCRLREGRAMGSSDSMLPWRSTGGATLPDEFKEANRAQARHIGHKLTRIGCAVAPRGPAGRSFQFRPAEVELLAEMEHQRWMADRIAAGWTFGNPSQHHLKQRDCLVPWAALPEHEREKDRQAVLSIPGVLADVGLEVIRLG